jgi:hypothetical protein
MTEVADKVERAIARFDRVTRQLDQRGGPVQSAARRERQRLNSDLFTRVKRALFVLIGIGVVTIGIGLDTPIGLFGFLGAVILAVVAAGVLLAMPTRTRTIAAPSPDLPNAEMVDRFDSYIYRVRPALPAPAQAQIDAISAALSPLKQTLERVDTLDPRAQDARRLMSIHLPGLIDRYRNVPSSYRGERDGEGKTVDQRLIESLAATRTALGEVSEQLARQDLAAFETQGRFIASRYGEETMESEEKPAT